MLFKILYVCNGINWIQYIHFCMYSNSGIKMILLWIRMKRNPLKTHFNHIKPMNLFETITEADDDFILKVKFKIWLIDILSNWFAINLWWIQLFIDSITFLTWLVIFSVYISCDTINNNVNNAFSFMSFMFTWNEQFNTWNNLIFSIVQRENPICRGIMLTTKKKKKNKKGIANSIQ